MRAANKPENEHDRLQNLYSYTLLDTLPEKDYDDITKLASYICETSISLVTLVDEDRQWFKSAHGLNLKQTLREHAFCSHAILHPEEMMIVPDAEKDERFWDNPLVTGETNIKFYAGVPLVSEEGLPIGSLCVIDNKPKQLNKAQQEALKVLANQTIRLMQLHKKAKELAHNQQLLKEINNELEQFAQTASEKMKRPCDNAIEIADLMADKFDDVLDADGKQMISLVKYSCENIKSTIDLTLARAERLNLLQDVKSLFTFTELMQDLKQELQLSVGNILISAYPENDVIYFFKTLLLQIFKTLLSALIEFNDKENPLVTVGFQSTPNSYVFTIHDNGKGCTVFLRSGLFVLLESTDCKQKENEYTGRLNEVKKVVTMLSGSIQTRFEGEKGSSFIISLPK